jgi:outer membrane murein-binding lipoprotein Lpp
MTTNGSGNLTYRWLAGIAITLLVGGTVAWAKNTQDDLRQTQQTVASLSEQFAGIRAQVQAIDARTARIEAKLDNLGTRR